MKKYHMLYVSYFFVAGLIIGYPIILAINSLFGNILPFAISLIVFAVLFVVSTYKWIDKWVVKRLKEDHHLIISEDDK